MGQLNVTLDDGLLENVDRLASTRGQSRPEFLRALIREAITSDADGLPLFTSPAAPSDLARLAELARQLSQLNIDLDRTMRDSDRRTTKLEKLFNGSEEGNRLAQERLAGQLRERLAEGYKPFRSAVETLREEIAEHLSKVHTAVSDQPQIASVVKRLDRLDESVKQARPHVAYHVDFLTLNRAGLAAIGVVCLAVAAFLLVVAGKVLPDSVVAVPTSIAMFGSSETAMCALYKQAYGATHCPTRDNEKPDDVSQSLAKHGKRGRI